MKDIRVGTWYRAKRPQMIDTGLPNKLLNDRKVLWYDADQVQYIGPVIRPGQAPKVIPRPQFEKWADRILRPNEVKALEEIWEYK